MQNAKHKTQFDGHKLCGSALRLQIDFEFASLVSLYYGFFRHDFHRMSQSTFEQGFRPAARAVAPRSRKPPARHLVHESAVAPRINNVDVAAFSVQVLVNPTELGQELVNILRPLVNPLSLLYEALSLTPPSTLLQHPGTSLLINLRIQRRDQSNQPILQTLRQPSLTVLFLAALSNNCRY